MGAASSRDRFNSWLEAAPTSVFFSYLDLPDKRMPVYTVEQWLFIERNESPRGKPRGISEG